MNALIKEARTITPAKDIAGRVKAIDWERVSKDLDAQGCAMIEGLITRQECDVLAELYPVDAIFRSRVVMRRHGFGRGEYKYFSYPLPDYNCLHQDLYGEHVFPLQATILLSEPERDFTGGEFVLTEQRPRMQSRPEVVPLRQGDAVVFAVNQRPVQGARGVYRVTLRHGVSRARSGHRQALGVIFHDAT